MPKAYSYVRFSTPEQMKGHSLRRQMERSELYARENGLDFDETLTMQDKGISAFKGKNLTHGALGSFMQLVDAGKIEKGSYLLIENLDRLSRDRAADAMGLFTKLVNRGIVVVTLQDNKKYSVEMSDGDIMFSLMSMIRANEESRVKSDRVSRAWSNKIKNAHIKPITKWVPSWLELSSTGKFVVVQDRAKVVKDIYQWSAKGLGTSLIIRELDKAKIKPFGMPRNINSTGKREPKKWHPSYIQRLLTNRAVLGEYTSSERVNRTSETFKGYYPAIIDEKLFYHVQQVRNSRDVSVGRKGPGRKGETLTNLFGGLLVCGYSIDDNDGGYKCAGQNQSMVVSSKGGAGSTRYLQCSRHRDGNLGCETCKGKYWRYPDFEIAFLDHVREIDHATVIGTPNHLADGLESVKTLLATVEGEIKNNAKAKARLDTILDEYLRGDNVIPVMFRKKAVELEEEEVRLLEQERQLKGSLTSAQDKLKSVKHGKKELTKLIDLLETLEGPELFDLRMRLSETIKNSVVSISIFNKGAIDDKEYWEKLKKRSKRWNEIITNVEKEAAKNNPFFVVNYHSGEARTVYPCTEGPELRDVGIVDGRQPIITGKDQSKGYSVRIKGHVNLRSVRKPSPSKK